MVVVACAGSVVLASACASSSGRVAEERCALSSADSAHLANGPVYPDCAVTRPARAAQTRLDYTPRLGGATAQTTCYNAEVTFVVGPDGRPESGTVRLLNSSDRAFADALLASVPGWTYTPALLDGVPVRQIVRERRVGAIVVSPAGAGRPSGPPRGANCR